MEAKCPKCGSDVIWDGACQTWPTELEWGTQWMSCQGCFSAVNYICSEIYYLSETGSECDWTYEDGLNPNNPRAASNTKNRPDWLGEEGRYDPMEHIPKDVRFISD